MKKLGINGIGRIGKLSLWYSIASKFFDEIVVNLGREVGSGVGDIAHYIERDSTYGSLSNFLYGFHAKKQIVDDIDENQKSIVVDGVKIKFLQSFRNPKDIEWKENGVDLVLDTTGKFLDPNLPADYKGGSIRGHLEAGAKKVLISAPFKFSTDNKKIPEDSVMTVMGINDSDYDSAKHCIISNASCTTTCLSHMLKPLLDKYGVDKVLSVSMITAHAATGSQKVLDSLPKAAAKDFRKNRAILNNIILTSTGAAKALKYVIPEIAQTPFTTQSIRIPTSTGSLVILSLNIKDVLSKDDINKCYEERSSQTPFLVYSKKANVSCDIIGYPFAGVIIEALETVSNSFKIGDENLSAATVYGWYDNELGSYVHMLFNRLKTL